MAPRTTTRPPEDALPVPEVGASSAAGAGAAAGALGAAAGTAAGVAASAPAAAGLLAAARAAEGGAEAILRLLTGFQVLSRAREERWIVRLLLDREEASKQDVLGAVADENARRAMFDRRVTERVRAALGPALALPSARERRDAVEALLRREQAYAASRSAAMATRTLALLDRLVLRRESPLGARWNLGMTVNHTPGCVRMAGHSFPWEVLDRFHPPVHPGCDCFLAATTGAFDAAAARERARQAMGLEAGE